MAKMKSANGVRPRTTRAHPVFAIVPLTRLRKAAAALCPFSSAWASAMLRVASRLPLLRDLLSVVIARCHLL